VGRIIARDQGLSFAVLRAANATRYGGREEVRSVHQGVTRLGARNLLRVVTLHLTSSTMSESGRAYGLTASQAQLGALAGAVAAETLAAQLGHEQVSEAFTAALLRDCGKLAMAHLVGVDQLLEDLAGGPTGSSRLDRERELYGFDHTEAGDALARLWMLPEPIPSCILHHHGPPEGSSAIEDVVYAGDVVASHLGLGIGHDGLDYPMDENILSRMGLDRHGLGELLVEVTWRLRAFEEQGGADRRRKAS
jgi:HD-like signal output (HDOD) protein